MRNLYISLLIIACMSNWLWGQTLVQNNFLSGITSCPLMEVQMQPSANAGFYTINYCNHGNSLATNVYVDIELNQNSYIAESPFPSTYIDGNLYRINLADVQSSKCASFDIKIATHDASLANCTKVYIYPNDPCQAMIESYLEMHSYNAKIESNGDVVTNQGIATAAQSSTERTRTSIGLLGSVNSIFEDNVMLNNIPVWDSLFHLFNNNNAGQSVGNDDNTTLNSTLNNGKGEAGDDDSNDNQNTNVVISELFWAEYCEESTSTIPTTPTTNNNINSVEEELVPMVGVIPVVSESKDNKNTNATSNQSKTNLVEENLNDEITKNTAVSIFPNPFHHQTTIRLSGMDFQNATFVLIDITGKILQTTQFQSPEMVLQKESLSAGLYIYQIVKNEKIELVGKVVVR